MCVSMGRFLLDRCMSLMGGQRFVGELLSVQLGTESGYSWVQFYLLRCNAFFALCST